MRYSSKTSGLHGRDSNKASCKICISTAAPLLRRILAVSGCLEVTAITYVDIRPEIDKQLYKTRMALIHCSRQHTAVITSTGRSQALTHDYESAVNVLASAVCKWLVLGVIAVAQISKTALPIAWQFSFSRTHRKLVVVSN